MTFTLPAIPEVLTVDEIIEREIEAGQLIGPYHRSWLLERRAPEHVRRLIEKARLRPDIVNTRQGFAGMDANDFPPGSFTAIASSTSETNLWTPAIWTPIAANDVRAGKVYKVQFGGIIQTTATPTYIWTPRFGQSSTPASNVTLGASATVTAGTIAASSPFYGEFVLGIRSLNVAASLATGTGNGYVVAAQAAGAVSQTMAMGGTVATTLDSTTAQGLIVGLTWGTSNASNTCTCQWAIIRSYN